MKIRLLLFLLLVFCSTINNAQTIFYANKEYKIKGDKIFHEGNDITSSFSDTDKESIFKKAKEQKEINKEKRKAEKKEKKKERKIEKERKEKERKEKLIENHKNAQNKLAKAENKYQKLKLQGKLSPVDESKWIDKIEKLKEKVAKAESKLD